MPTGRSIDGFGFQHGVTRWVAGREREMYPRAVQPPALRLLWVGVLAMLVVIVVVVAVVRGIV